jgi:hypothetical protein
MSNKYLLVISKNYWGANTSEECALTFSSTFSELLHIPSSQITHLIGNDVNVSSVKNTIYNFVYFSLANRNHNPVLFIYMNGHGNQTIDANGDEIINSEDTQDTQDTQDNQNEIDPKDELYQLPDGNFIDDELTDTINSAVFYSNSVERPLVVLISDHCSSGSMLDKLHINYFDWISIGACGDKEDAYTTGDGNVMTMNLLNMLKENKDDIPSLTTLSFYKLLDNEMKTSFIGELQHATLHVSSKLLLKRELFS